MEKIAKTLLLLIFFKIKIMSYTREEHIKYQLTISSTYLQVFLVLSLTKHKLNELIESFQ